MPDQSTDALAVLVESVASSSNYRHISRELIASVGERELTAHGRRKEAVKATKQALHQVVGSYLAPHLDIPAWLAWLREAEGDQEALRQTCRRIMAYHASTRERLGSLDHFYTDLLTSVGPVSSILDIACGLNPLAVPWMPLAPGATYSAYDVHLDIVAFLQEFFAILGVAGAAESRDVVRSCPTDQVQVALLLKCLPCLEHLDRRAGARLLAEVDADHLVVSFPTGSLSGRKKGMVETYEARFRELVADKPRSVRRFAYPNELVFLVTR